MRWLSALVCFACVPDGTARAVDHPCAAGEPISGVAASAGRGGSFALASASWLYRLSGIVGPGSSVRGRITLHPTAPEPDRYGRTPVHAFSDGNWVQGDLLMTGAAVIFAGAEAAECLAAMRAAEAQAIRARAGLWNEPRFRLRSGDVDAMADHSGRLVVVTGRVLSVGDRKSRLYLNFGKKWTQDFTVSVVKTGRGKFKERDEGALGRLLAARGKTVRIRGVLEQRQGPLIRLVDEAQIEYLD